MATYSSNNNPSPYGQPQSFLKKSTIIWGIVGLLLITLLVGGCSTYNGMVTKEEAVNKAWGDVQAAYQRRFDLIPNLVNTVKGYAKHESETLKDVTNARAGLIQTGDSLMAVRDGLTAFDPNGNGPSVEQFEQLHRGMDLYINAVHEAYPDLKANENFADLQKQLESTENRINQERNLYNDAVQKYNVSIRRFPASIFAGMFGFSTKQQFQASAQAQNAVTVEF